MKKLGLLIAMISLFAVATYAQSVATDYGTKQPINHSNGAITFDFGKLQRAKCITNPDGGTTCVNKYAATLSYYNTIAAYPTTFVPTVSFDGGCQKIQLVETATPISGFTAGKPVFCEMNLPITELDAGVLRVYRETDGGYGVSQCPATATLTTAAWPAFCYVQNGVVP